jgi:hypothetical protein
VVFPASIWAIMPIFRVLSSVNSFVFSIMRRPATSNSSF